jgi:hypothetical protein
MGDALYALTCVILREDGGSSTYLRASQHSSRLKGAQKDTGFRFRETPCAFRATTGLRLCHDKVASPEFATRGAAGSKGFWFVVNTYFPCHSQHELTTIERYIHLNGQDDECGHHLLLLISCSCPVRHELVAPQSTRNER